MIRGLGIAYCQSKVEVADAQHPKICLPLILLSCIYTDFPLTNTPRCNRMDTEKIPAWTRVY